MDTLIAFAADRRRARRSRVFREGKVVIPALNITLPVVVRNISASGACLQISASQLLPREFDLHIVSQLLLFRARLRWRHGELVGVEFVGDPRHIA